MNLANQLTMLRMLLGIAVFIALLSGRPWLHAAALALFLDRCFSGKELGRKFGGKLRIVPNACGKVVLHDESD